MHQKRLFAASMLPLSLFLAACQADVGDDDEEYSSAAMSSEALSEAATDEADSDAAMIVSISPTASGGTMQIDRVTLTEGDDDRQMLSNASQQIETLALSDEMEIELTGTGGTTDGTRVTADELVRRFQSDSALRAMPFQIEQDVDGRVTGIEQIEYAY